MAIREPTPAGIRGKEPNNMESQRNSNQTEHGMRILTDFSLWCSLFPDPATPGRHKFTRGEAFFDLLSRQRQNAVTYERDVVSGSYQSLADCWGWHRQTVKKFLQELTAIGAVTIEATSNRTVIHVSNVTMTSSAPADLQNPSRATASPIRGNPPP